MKKLHTIWFLALLLTTSVCLPITGNAAEVSVFSAEQNTHIRALAASCAACHGTLGNAVGNNSGGNAAGTNSATDTNGANAVLAGIDPAEFTTKMLGFKDGSRKATVMHHHAKGLNMDEINQLAVHFSQQKRVAKSPIKSEILKAEHD
ncbi:MAG: class I cytochrome c [Methylotenera sp.]|nr:class I cytochrome c [Methylotenera sp.]